MCRNRVIHEGSPEKCKCIILPKNYPCDLSFSISDVQVAILIFKAVNGMLPGYISDLLVVGNNVKCLRGTNKLVVPRKKTSNFGLKSTTFIGAKCGIPYRIDCVQRKSLRNLRRL